MSTLMGPNDRQPVTMSQTEVQDVPQQSAWPTETELRRTLERDSKALLAIAVRLRYLSERGIVPLAGEAAAIRAAAITTRQWFYDHVGWTTATAEQIALQYEAWIRAEHQAHMTTRDEGADEQEGVQEGQP